MLKDVPMSEKSRRNSLSSMPLAFSGCCRCVSRLPPLQYSITTTGNPDDSCSHNILVMSGLNTGSHFNYSYSVAHSHTMIMK